VRDIERQVFVAVVPDKRVDRGSEKGGQKDRLHIII